MKRIGYFVLAVAVFGCGPKKTTTDKVTLTWSLFGAQLYGGYTAIVDSADFKAKFPNVTITFNDAPDPNLPNGISTGDVAQRIPNCLANNNCYDIETLENAFAAQVFPSGVFVPLNKYAVDLTQYPDVSASVVKAADGTIYGIPVDTAPELMFYRVDLVGQALAQLQGTTYPTAQADIDTYNSTVVEPYMDALTWDDYLDLTTGLAKLLFVPTTPKTPDATAFNQGWPVYPLHTLEGFSTQMFPEQTNWLKDNALNPDLIPFINKYVRLEAQFYRGLGDGVAGDDIPSARANSYVSAMHWTAGGVDLCSDKSTDGSGTEILSYTDPGFFGGSAMTCQIVSGQGAILLGAAWRGESFESWQSGISGSDAPNTLNREAASNNATPWSSGLWRVTALPGLKAGDGVAAIDHLYSLDGGSYLGVTKACKNPDVAAAVIKYFTSTVSVQIANFKAYGAFPAYKPAWSDPSLADADPFFGGQSFTPKATDTLSGVNANGKRIVAQGSCQNQISAAFSQTIVQDIALDAADASNIVDLSDAGISALQAKVVSDFSSAIGKLVADPTACTDFSSLF